MCRSNLRVGASAGGRPSPRDAHLGGRRSSSEAEVHRRVGVCEADLRREGEHAEAGSRRERTFEERPADGRAHVGHAEVVVARGELRPAQEFDRHRNRPRRSAFGHGWVERLHAHLRGGRERRRELADPEGPRAPRRQHPPRGAGVGTRIGRHPRPCYVQRRDVAHVCARQDSRPVHAHHRVGSCAGRVHPELARYARGLAGRSVPCRCDCRCAQHPVAKAVMTNGRKSWSYFGGLLNI